MFSRKKKWISNKIQSRHKIQLGENLQYLQEFPKTSLLFWKIAANSNKKQPQKWGLEDSERRKVIFLGQSGFAGIGVEIGKEDKVWLLWVKGSIPGHFLFVLTINPFFPRVSHKSRCSLALDEGWNWGFGAVGGHSQQQSSHTSPLLSPSKKLLFKKKIKYVKPFTKDRMRDQSQNQLWKTTTIILLLRYFNSFNLKVILAKTKLSHPRVDQHHI